MQPTSLVQDRNTVEVIDCKFIESSTLKTIRSNLTLSNCKFLHLTLPTSDNPMIVYNSNVNLTGSKFIDADQTAVLAFYNTAVEEERVTQRDSDQPTLVTSTYVNFRDSILEDSLTFSNEKESSHRTHSSY